MFFIEGIPAVIMGIFAWFWLDDTPAKARFLNDEEKKALIAQLQQEQRQTETSSVGTALKSLKVWHLALIYGTIQISVYGLMFFLPSQVASLMGSTLGFKESLVAAIPWACSAVGVYYIPRLADKMPARRVLISVICMLAAALGLFPPGPARYSPLPRSRYRPSASSPCNLSSGLSRRRLCQAQRWPPVSAFAPPWAHFAASSRR